MVMIDPPNGYHHELGALLNGLPILRRRLRPGNVLFYADDPGDSALLVRSGLVGLEVSGGHREPVVARLYRPGDLIAVGRLLMPGTPQEGTARALADTEVQLIRWGDLRERRVDEDVHCLLVQAMVGDARFYVERLMEATQLASKARVALSLCRLADEDDVVRVSQDAIAAVAGVVRPTANSILRSMAARDLVNLARRQVTLLDRGALERLGR